MKFKIYYLLLQPFNQTPNMKPDVFKMCSLLMIILGSLLLSACLKLVTDQFPEMEPVPTVNSYLVPARKAHYFEIST